MVLVVTLVIVMDPMVVLVVAGVVDTPQELKLVVLVMFHLQVHLKVILVVTE